MQKLSFYKDTFAFINRTLLWSELPRWYKWKKVIPVGYSGRIMEMIVVSTGIFEWLPKHWCWLWQKRKSCSLVFERVLLFRGPSIEWSVLLILGVSFGPDLQLEKNWLEVRAKVGAVVRTWLWMWLFLKGRAKVCSRDIFLPIVYRMTVFPL